MKKSLERVDGQSDVDSEKDVSDVKDLEDSGSDESSGPKLQLYQWFILMSLNTIGPFSSDAYIPNLNAIASDLNASDEAVSLTIQINWIMLGLWNPVIGHLSDKYGRKRVIYVALVVYCIGAFLSSWAPTIFLLNVARCIQGCGEAVSVITTAVIRDVVDDMDERMKLMAFFSMMRPIMLLAAPVFGGGVASAIGWRSLFYILAAWGLITLVLVYFCIPESNAKKLKDDAKKAAAKAGHAQVEEEDDEPVETFNDKLSRMWFDHSFIGLTIVAALYMGAVRSMLSNISFVYENYYKMNTFATGLLISVPTMCGFFSSMTAIKVVRKYSTVQMLRYGMAACGLAPILMFLVAGNYHCEPCPYGMVNLVKGHKYGWGSSWWIVTVCVAVMSGTGFFALPAMQTVVMQDLKDISGLAGGLSKMGMQFTSTGMSMIASYVFTRDGDLVDDSRHHFYTHYHTQRLLYTLGAMLLICQLYFWGVYTWFWPTFCRGWNLKTIFGMPIGQFLWMVVFCGTGVGLGMSFEFMERNSAPMVHGWHNHKQVDPKTFFLCLIGYWSQVVVGGAYCLTRGDSELYHLKGTYQKLAVKGVAVMVLVSALFDASAQALDFYGQEEGGYMLFTIFHASVTFFSCIIAVIVLRTSVSLVQWCGILLIIAGLFATSVPQPIKVPDGGSFLWGFTCSLIGSFCLAASYPFSELVFRYGQRDLAKYQAGLAEDEGEDIEGEEGRLLAAGRSDVELVPCDRGPISEEFACFFGSFINAILYTIWTLYYTVPKWDYTISDYIAEGKQTEMIWGYVLYGVMVGLHSLSFWKSVNQAGTVPTAVCKGAQQAGVFVFSDLIYCNVDVNECFTTNYCGGPDNPCTTWNKAQKSVAFVLVCIGVLVYSLSKKTKKEEVHNDDDPMAAATDPLLKSDKLLSK